MEHSRNVFYCLFCGKSYSFLPVDSTCSVCHQSRFKHVNLEIQDPRAALIIKIQNKHVLTSMRSGNLWFQSPKLFHEYIDKGKKARADIHDSRYSFMSPHGNVDDKNVDTYRILCFYSLDVDNDGNIISKPHNDLTEFGDYFSSVNLKLFMEILHEYFGNPFKEISYVANWVNYLANNYSGAYSPFCKMPEFQYQKEFRVVLLSDTFLLLGKKDPYITIPPVKMLNEMFTEPQEINKLLTASHIKDLGLN